MFHEIDFLSKSFFDASGLFSGFDRMLSLIGRILTRRSRPNVYQA